VQLTRTLAAIALVGATAGTLATASAPVAEASPHTGSATHSAATATPASQAELRAQATDEGLSARQSARLQTRVDRQVARTGGVQVAINQVNWPGGETLVPLPGERRAHELGTAARGTKHGCLYLRFCTYSDSDFTGLVEQYLQCFDYLIPYVFGSYVNNQTDGTRAEFKDSDHHHLTFTKPAYGEGTTSFGVQTWFIKPC
jgi:hypothetical protein